MSGYIETVHPPGQEKMVGVDASHAWFAIPVPGSGWGGYDPTNNIMPEGQHIFPAWGEIMQILPLYKD
ncbi:transglutaminase-like domain-containing protein [Klebsiella variicola]|uniref:transglutaminase-like domain-containing protein n=1 Tax=Klebsiella variicola TaxID=244366 RepID=UPI00215ABBC2|nr:transglutaminase family protein [Klebsiella variicola]